MEFPGSAFFKEEIAQHQLDSLWRVVAGWPGMNLERLEDCCKKELARMARDQGVIGWHAMRKEELIQVLTLPVSSGSVSLHSGNTVSDDPSPNPDAKTVSSPSHGNCVKSARAPKPSNSDGRTQKSFSRSKSATSPSLVSVLDTPPLTRTLSHGCNRDRIITMVRDSFWLHVYWELSRSTLSRAQAALGQDWHLSRPILRVMDVSSEDTTSVTERHVRDIEIHGGVNNWFIDVSAPPRSFRIDIGYLSRRGKFYILARSNVVTTPKVGTTDMLDQNWLNLERDYERMVHQSASPTDQATIHSALRELFEDKLKRPMNNMAVNPFGNGGFPLLGRKFHFEIGAELVIYGNTEPSAKVTLQGEQVPIRPDGSFSVRYSLPDARQIIPAVATSSDGVEERTVVLAVERNTKELEPMIHDGNDF